MTHEIPGQEPPFNHERKSRKVMVTLSQNDARELDSLKEISGIEVDATAMRDLLIPGGWIADELVQGAKIVSRRPDGTEIIYQSKYSQIGKGIIARQEEIPQESPALNSERGNKQGVFVPLSPTEREYLDEIKRITGIANDEDVMRDLLIHGLWIAGELAKGATIMSATVDDTIIYDTKFSMVARHILEHQEDAHEREKLKSFTPPPDSSIDVLDLPTYVQNRLIKKGINTIQALKNEDVRRLRAIGLGDGSLTKINEALAKISQDNPRE